jgi:hypothetical protein
MHLAGGTKQEKSMGRGGSDFGEPKTTRKHADSSQVFSDSCGLIKTVGAYE